MGLRMGKPLVTEDFSFNTLDWVSTRYDLNLSIYNLHTSDAGRTSFLHYATTMGGSDGYWPAIEQSLIVHMREQVKTQLSVVNTAALQGIVDNISWGIGYIGPEWHIYACYPVFCNKMQKWKYVRLNSSTVVLE